MEKWRDNHLCHLGAPEVTGAPSDGSGEAAADCGRGRRVLHLVGEVVLLLWTLGVFWYYYESQDFGELVLHLLGRTG